MKKIYNRITIALFLSVLFLTPIFLFLSKDNDFSENENRYLSQKPTISVDDILSGEFMQNTEKYIDDQFPFRDTWTAMKSDILQLTGNKEVNGVYWCADQYLIEKWLDCDFDEQQLQQNIDCINSFSENHPDQKTSVMIVPTAGLILKDKLPSNAPMFDQNIAFSLIENNLSDSCYIDVREPLFSHREDGVYYKTDHHWTTYGAYLGYEKWCQEHNCSVQSNDFEIKSVTDSFKGSLYSKVLSKNCPNDEINLYDRKNQIDYVVDYNFGKTQSDSVYALENLEKKDKYQVFFNGNHPELTIRTSQSNGKQLLIFKDSFANAFVPFLLNDYETIHMIDLRYYNADPASYISENGITECLFLYNVKNFCEEKNLSKIIN